jgi:hypothetical protein
VRYSRRERIPTSNAEGVWASINLRPDPTQTLPPENIAESSCGILGDEGRAIRGRRCGCRREA